MNFIKNTRRRQCCPFSCVSLAILSVTFFSWSDTVSAELVCTSPKSLPSGLLPDTPVTLGFSDDSLLGGAIWSDITADLICSATGSKTLILGSGYRASQFSPHSPIVNISTAQATEALQLCPSNSFNIVYTGTSLLSSQSAKCSGDFSIKLPVTVTTPTKAPPVVTSSETASSTLSQTNTSTGTPKTVSNTTTTLSTTATPPVHNSTKPTSSSSSPPLTTKPGPTGDNSNKDGGQQDNSPEQTTQTSSTSLPTTVSADLQQQTGMSSPSFGSIIGPIAGVIAAVLLALACLLLWRKRQQKKIAFELFYDESLVAASGHSGFQDRALYRSETIKEAKLEERVGASHYETPTITVTTEGGCRDVVQGLPSAPPMASSGMGSPHHQRKYELPPLYLSGDSKPGLGPHMSPPPSFGAILSDPSMTERPTGRSLHERKTSDPTTMDLTGRSGLGPFSPYEEGSYGGRRQRQPTFRQPSVRRHQAPMHQTPPTLPGTGHGGSAGIGYYPPHRFGSG
ncbi:hypothetical protein BGW38_002472 [Lunasporangiospora selenospora]|uniref:Uncharacterized protein n=1 Tax=Lunasporangiospora selenospora TaxID=979761 RepID=A0A9P6G0V6_9FUNG|nr:hypothetical protein BGW38_002472 [Lunasporangiospora selenospora]